jgi:hypothetical protein
MKGKKEYKFVCFRCRRLRAACRSILNHLSCLGGFGRQLFGLPIGVVCDFSGRKCPCGMMAWVGAHGMMAWVGVMLGWQQTEVEVGGMLPGLGVRHGCGTLSRGANGEVTTIVMHKDVAEWRERGRVQCIATLTHGGLMVKA